MGTGDGSEWVRQLPKFERQKMIGCTSKFTKTVTSRFSGLPVKNEPEAELELKEEERVRVPPKANDLTDRFEDVDQLLLWVAQDTKHGRKPEKHFPRPCCRARFQLCHMNVNQTSKKNRAHAPKTTLLMMDD